MDRVEYEDEESMQQSECISYNSERDILQLLQVPVQLWRHQHNSIQERLDNCISILVVRV